MSARRALLLTASALMLAAALATPAAALLPVGVRIALTFVVLVLAPGVAWWRAIGEPGPGGAWLAGGRVLGLGVAWMGLGVLVTRMAGLPFTALVAWGAPWSALPWLAAWAWATRTAVAHETLPRAARIAVVVAAGIALVHVAHQGTSLSFHTDSPDHIGTVRRMLASGDAFPTDAFFRDAGPGGADPRKGLWHPVVASVCRLAQADPVAVWRGLAVLLAALFAVTAGSLGWWLGGPLGAATAALALPLTYGGGLGTQYLGEAVFATKLADQLALSALAVMLADLEARRRRTRLAVIAAMAGTIAVHVFGAIQFAVVFGSLALALALRDRAFSPAARRVLLTAAAGALAVAPYLAWRALQAYAPVNVIHTERQGMLELWPGVDVVSFGVLWDWLGGAWILFPLSLVAWWRAAARPAVLALAATTTAVGVLLFVPPVVHALEPRLGYLLMRLPWLLPSSAAVAFLVVALVAAWRARRLVVVAGCAVTLALGLALPLGDAVHALASLGRPRVEGPYSVLHWNDALAWMDRELPMGTVVLSDPATAYAVPMMTRHWVTLLLDQHSSPNDSLALTRILDARDALDPHADWATTRRVLRRWGATAIVLNGRIEPDGPGLDYWSATPDWYQAARARLETQPGAFERVWEQDHISIYRVRDAALDALPAGDGSRPGVRLATAADSGRVVAADRPRLLSFRLERAEAAHGDTVAGLAEWRVERSLPAGSYRVAVRFDRALPADAPPGPKGFSKPWRKLLERLRGERYRFRDDHLPLGGAHGVDRWRPDQVQQDAFRIVVPGDVAPGDYTVKVTMVHDAHYPNLRLRDFLDDDDVLDGVEVARLRVVGGEGR